jgi:hypothetical protein
MIPKGSPICESDWMRRGIEVRLVPGDREPLEAGIVDLQAAINRFLVETNQNPQPFTWNADPGAMIEKVRRGKQALNSFGVAR